MKHLELKISYIAIVVILLSSCVKEEFNGDLLSKSVELNGGVAVPIGYTTLSLSKLLHENTKPEELVIDADSFMTLIYYDHVFSFTADKLITIAPVKTTTGMTNSFPVDLDLSTFSSGTILSDSTAIWAGFYNTDSERLDSIVLKNAELIINATPNTEANIVGSVQIIFPTLTKNGVPYTASFDLNTGGVTEKNLSLYTVGLKTISGNFNMIPVYYSLNLQSGSGIVPKGQNIIDLSVDFSFMNYKEIYGFIGNRKIELEESGLALDFYKEIIEGSFHFEAPEINLYFKNSFGVPLGISIPDFYSTNRDKSNTAITSDDITNVNNPFTINYPDYSMVGTSVADTLRLTPTNTNLFEVLEQAPLRVNYSILGQTISDNPANNLNFITDQSSFDVEVEMVLPLWGYAQTLLMQDTLRFDINELYNKDIDELKQLTFRLNINNGFPIDVAAQIYFVDEKYQLQDSLFIDNNIISSATDTNNDGVYEPFKNPVLEVTIDRDKIEKIKNTKHIFIRGRIATGNIDEKQNVKFYSFYKIDANLGVIATLVSNTSKY